MRTIGLAILCSVFFVCGASAQTTEGFVGDYDLHVPKAKNAIPLLRCGAFVGRSGVAFGPSISCDANPFSWIGAYWFIGRSSIDGYQTQGVSADEANRTAGVGIVARPFAVKSFRFGAFAQAGYSGSHTQAFVADQLVYQASNKDPLITVGPDIEYRIPHGPWLVVRLGRNFGDQLASGTAGGFSVNGGVMFDPVPALKGIGKKLFR